MNRKPIFLTILLLLFFSCGEDTVINSGNGLEGIRLKKITQRFGIGPYGIDPNQIQFGIFHYDINGNMTKYEFLHGKPGEEKLTIYEDLSYENGKLILVDHFIFYNNEFVKSRIEELEYDDSGRLKATKISSWSEITDSWSDATTTFQYNEGGLLIKKEQAGWDVDLLFYDENQNLIKHEHHPIFASDYSGPIVKTFRYDNQRNPLQSLTERFWLPLGNGGSALGFLMSPNNVLSWDGYSPQTGGVISRGVFEFEYNADGYPISSLETVTSPLTDPEPGVVLWLTDYEYEQ